MLPELNSFFFFFGCLFFPFWRPRGKTPRGHLKAIKWDFCLITIGLSIKTFETNLPPLRTLVSPRGMARNQQWAINKWPLKNIGPLVKTHIHSRAATVHVSTHSLPISSALFAKTLLSNEVEGLQSHRDPAQLCHRWVLFSLRTAQSAIEGNTHQSGFITTPTLWMNCPAQAKAAHNCPGEEIGLPGTPLQTKLDCQYGPQTFEKSRKTMEQKINTPKPQWWLHLVN